MFSMNPKSSIVISKKHFYAVILGILNFCISIEAPPDGKLLLEGKAESKVPNSSKGVNKFYLNIEKRIYNEYDLAKRAEELMDAKEYAHAISFYNRAIKKSSKKPSHYKKRGICHLETQQPDFALSDFRTALDLFKPENLENESQTSAQTQVPFITESEFERLASQLYNRGNFEGADWCLKHAIDLNPGKVKYHLLRGSCNRFRKIWDLAIENYKNALLIEPENVETRKRLKELFAESGKYDDALDASLSFTHTDLAWLGDQLRQKEGRYEEAIKFYSAAIEKYSRRAEYYENRGRCFAELQQWDMAVNDFREVLRLDPQNFLIRLKLTRALVQGGRYDEAARVALDADDLESVRIVGSNLCTRGKFDDAINFYTEEISENDAEATLYKLRSDCFRQMGNKKMVISDLKQALELDPSNKNLRIHLSRTLFDFGKYKEAIEEMILAKDDNELINLAEKFTSVRQFDKAIICYDEAVNRNSNDPIYYVLRGECYVKMGDIDVAALNLRKALEIDPKNRDIRIQLSETFSKVGRYDEAIDEMILLDDDEELVKLAEKFMNIYRFKEAIRCYDELVNKYPTDTFSYILRSKCYVKMREIDTAAVDLRKALEIEPTNMDIRIMLSEMFFKVGRYDEAIDEMILLDDNDELEELATKFMNIYRFNEALRCYDELIKKNSNNPSFYVLRSEFHVKRRDTDHAVSDLRSALEIAPDDGDIRIQLSETFYRAGRYDEAIDEMVLLNNDSELIKLAQKFLDFYRLKEALRCYEELIKKNSENPHYYTLRSKCYLKMQAVDHAVADLRTALLIAPDNRDIRIQLSNTFYTVERYDEAIDEIMLLNDDNELTRLGKLFLNLNKFKEAIRCYNKLVERNALDSFFYNLRSDCFLKMQDIDAAVSDLRKAIEYSPDSKRFRIKLSKTFYDAQKYDESIDEILQLNDDDETIKLAQLFMDSNNLDKAIRCYNEALKNDTKKTIFYKLRSECHVKMGSMDMAVSDMKSALELDPKNKDFMIQLSMTLFNAEKYNEAIEEMNQVNDEHELTKLGNLFMDSNKFEEAIRCYDDALKRNELNETCYKKRGTSYWNLQKFEPAILNFVTSLEIDPMDIGVQADLCEVLFDAGRHTEANNGLQLFLKYMQYRRHKFEVISQMDLDKIEKVRLKVGKKENGEPHLLDQDITPPVTPPVSPDDQVMQEAQTSPPIEPLIKL